MTKEYLGMIIQLVTASFGLVAALAWNTLIQSVINLYYPPGVDLTGQLIYAIVITLFAVLITTNLARLHDKISKKEEQASKRK